MHEFRSTYGFLFDVQVFTEVWILYQVRVFPDVQVFIKLRHCA